jgi:excisionase family DNA binding protein
MLRPQMPNNLPSPGADPPPPTRLSIAEAAARLGVSPDTLRRRIKRGELQAQRDNAGKPWLVLPADLAEAPVPVPRRTTAYAPVQENQNGVIEELRSHVASLRSELDRAYADRERLLAMLASAQDALVPRAQEREGRFWARLVSLVSGNRQG